MTNIFNSLAAAVGKVYFGQVNEWSKFKEWDGVEPKRSALKLP